MQRILSLRFVLMTRGRNAVQTACGLGTHYHSEIYGKGKGKPFVKYNTNDIWSCSIHSYCLILQRAL